MSRTTWVAFEITLPHGGAVQVDVEPDGHLRAHLEIRRDPAALLILANALRAAVVDVDAQRAIMAVAAGPS